MNPSLIDFTAVSAILTAAVALLQFAHSNAIRRYEKFHEMSKRFDAEPSIQKVCQYLNGIDVDKDGKSNVPSKQEKEVFLCFQEEIYFMIKSGIMRKAIALHTFGFYVDMVNENEDRFWDEDMKKNNSYYCHFRDFCGLVRTYKPESCANRSALFSYQCHF